MSLVEIGPTLELIGRKVVGLRLDASQRLLAHNAMRDRVVAPLPNAFR